MIKGIDFDFQTISAANMGHIMHKLSGKLSGVTSGCAVTNSGMVLTVAAGYLFTCGRMTQILGTETVTVASVSSGTTYAYLVYEVDLSKTNTTSAFNQGALKVVTSSDTYPTLTQQDLDENPDDGVYQLPLVSFTVTASGIGNLTDVRNMLNFNYEERIGSLGNAIGMRGWCQLVNLTNGSWTNSVTDGRASFSCLIGNSISIADFNKTLTSAEVVNAIFTATYTGTAYMYHNGSNTNITVSSYACVAGHKYFVHFNCTSANASAVGGIVLSQTMVIDLTALFGSGNEPSVAEFRKMFPADYYPYCQGGFADLLWENASPTSSFSAQTVSLDLSAYKMFLISVYWSTHLCTFIGFVGFPIWLGVASTDSGGAETARRYATTGTNGINFSNSTKCVGATAEAVNNALLIPYQIYGVR